MGYKYNQFISVALVSSHKQLPGQSHRSSYNYSMKGLRQGSHMLWSCPEGVTFDVYQDNAGYAKLLATDVTNGMFTTFFDTDSLYIANPRTAKGCGQEGILIRVDSIGFSENRNKWQGKVHVEKNNLKISEFNIPGTHDSGAIRWFKNVPSFWSCQAASITSQLQAGVRLLDVRIKVKIVDRHWYFVVCHGDLPFGEFAPLNSLLDECRAFLDCNTSEFILMSLKIDDWNGIVDENARKSAMVTLLNVLTYRLPKRLPFKDYNYTEARGNVIFINRIADFQPLNQVLGECWPWEDNQTFSGKIGGVDFRVQDCYHVNSAEEKLEKVGQALKENDDGRININFCSGYRSIFSALPYKIDVLEGFLNLMGSTISRYNTRRQLGWFLFDFALKEKKITGEAWLNAVDAVIDSNFASHAYYNYHVME